MDKCFSGHFFENQMRQAGFYFYFPKTDEALFFISLKTNEATYFVHFKYKNVDILIFKYELNKWGHFFLNLSLKKRQMRGIWNR